MDLKMFNFLKHYGKYGFTVALSFSLLATTGCISTSNRGDNLMGVGKYHEAIKEYDKSSDYRAHMNKGIAYWRLADYDKARDSFANAKNTHPSDVSLAAYYLAILDYEECDLLSALQNIEESLDDDPNSIDALNLSGRINYDLKRFPHALKDFSNAIRLAESQGYKNTGYIFYNRALSYIALNSFQEAKADYQAFLEFIENRGLPVEESDYMMMATISHAANLSDSASIKYLSHISEGKRRELKSLLDIR